MASGVIKIGGAREHNLKNLTLEIPRDRLVVITGLSGSGKSSLAFDTLFAEGQRKYVESLSAYARQFLDQLQKPDVDFIEGLSPAIAIEQRTSGSNPRSTIATTTEIFDYLRLLFAHVGQPHCPVSGEPMSHQTPTEIADRIQALPERSRLVLLAPVVRDQKGEFRDVLERLAREGFVRARVDGEMVELGGPTRTRLDPKSAHQIDAVVDRLVIEERVRSRLGDSVETALKWGEGQLIVLHQPPPASGAPKDATAWIETRHSTRMFSRTTGESYDPPTPKHFSFNSPFGACRVCHGLAQKLVFDPGLVVPDPAKSLEQGAIVPWRRGGKRMIVYYKSLLKAVAAHYGQSLDTPYEALPADFRHVLMHGSGETPIDFHFARAGKVSKITRPFEGVLPNLDRLYQESESEFTRNRLKACMSPQPCDACGGRRLRPEILAVTLGDRASFARFRPAAAPPAAPGLSIMDVCSLTIDDAATFFHELRLTGLQEKIAADIIREISARLRFLRQVGLGYLTLDRESGTLSGGEAQRIRLATQIGAGLVGVLYILDEPSIGLHQRDNERLLQTLEGLRDLGNSVIVVEHDEDTIRRADHILDLGPGAGSHGGEIVAQGPLETILQHPKSLTGKYLRGELSIAVPRQHVAPSRDRGWLEILGARENNLHDIDARIPLGTLTCVTGVSGSGKSTLIDDILRRALFRKLHGSKERPGRHLELRGIELIDKAVVVDQTPIGRTPRSNPATYTGMFNHIRDLFAKLPAARIRGYDAGRFSFNVKGGRCEKCQGDGVLEIEMHFLPPVYVTCESCNGRRYNRETLEIAYKGLNIADILALTVDEAAPFFRAVSQIHDPCVTLAEVGLGYLRLGQQATTLSGGEAQRIKLAAELSRKSTGRTVYLLDEPTTGLHFHDVAKLIEVLMKLRASGNTLIVIEHNLDVIKVADWVIDLGPEGGAGGGRIVCEGPPERVAACNDSHTGRFLRKWLGLLTLALALLLLPSPTPLHAASPAETRALGVAIRLFQDNAFDSAEREFAEFVRKFPESKSVPEAILYQGQALYRLRAYARAETLLDQAAPRAGDLADQYLYWLAESRFAQNRMAQAAADFEKLLRDFPNSSRQSDAALGAAFAWHQLGQPDKVATLLANPDGAFQRIARTSTADDRVLRGKLLLAEVLVEQNKLEDARTALTTIANSQLQGDLAWQHNYLSGRVSLASGRTNEALLIATNLAADTALLNTRPDRPARLVAFHGAALQAAGDTAAALRILESNLATNVPPEWRRDALQRIIDLTLKEDRVPDAVSRLENFLGESGLPPQGLSSLRLLLGDLRLRQFYAVPPAERTNATNLLALARTQFSLILTNTNSPSTGRAALNLGWCLWEEFSLGINPNALPDAKLQFETAVSRLPLSEDQAIARFKLGDTLFALTNHPAAYEQYAALADGYPDFPRVRQELAGPALHAMVRAAVEMGDSQKAAAALSRLLADFPATPQAESSFLSLARGLRRLDLPREAGRLLEQFEQRFPESPLIAEVQLAMSRLQLSQGDWPRAITNLASWTTRHPDHPALPRALFDQARATAAAGDLTNALPLFTNVVARFPDHPVAPLAQNWVADHYFEHRTFDLAEDRYQRLYKNTNWTTTPIGLRANLMAGRSAFARGNARDARTYFTELINTLTTTGLTNPGSTLVAEAFTLLGDSILAQYLNDPARPPDLLRESVTAFRAASQTPPTNRFAVAAWGRLGDCYLLAGTADPQQLDNAAAAYTNVLTAPLSTADARSLAGIGLGKVWERKAELAAATDRPALRDEALRHYLYVLEGKHLADGESPDPFYLKEAGLAAARLAEDAQAWPIAAGVYRRLRDLVPSQKAAWEERLQTLETRATPR